MTMKKKITAVAALFSAVLLLGGCGKTNLGYIDGARVIKESPQITAIIDEGHTKIAEIEKQSAEEMKKKQAEGASAEDVQKVRADAQRKMAGLNQAYSTQVRQKVDSAMADIAKEKKLDAVLNNAEQEKVIFLGGTDVTDDVIKKLQ